MQPTGVTVEPKQLVLDMLANGRVMLLCDARHVDNQGLPPGNTAHILRVDILDLEDRVDFSDPDFLQLAYVDDASQHTARIPWSAVFVVVGQAVPGQLGPNIRPAGLPACFEPDRMANVQRLLLQMGIGGKPGITEWNLQVSSNILSMDADRSDWCPDKQDALRRVFARGVAVLLFDPAFPGVTLPPVVRQSRQAELVVGQGTPFENVTMTPYVLSWTHAESGHTLRFVVPWRAIGGIQCLQDGDGWWWPNDLPEQGRARLQGEPDAWPVLQRLEGIPLRKRAPMPTQAIELLVPAPPRPVTKALAIERYLQLGLLVVLVDALHPAIRLPATLPGRAKVLMVPLGLENLNPQLRFSDDGFSAVMPNYEGRVVPVQIPWQAVFMIAPADSVRTGVWAEDYPPAIVTALHALRSVQRSDGGELPAELQVLDHQPNGDGLGLGIKRGPDGSYHLAVSQPLGALQQVPPGSPPGTKARALMELAFRLPAPTLQ
jgi:hypothetical protein